LGHFCLTRLDDIDQALNGCEQLTLPRRTERGFELSAKELIEETTLLAGVASWALRLHVHQERVAITIRFGAHDSLSVAGSLSLVPHLLTAATPKPSLPLLQ